MSRPKKTHEMLAVLTESGRREVEKFNAEQSRISEQERYRAELAVLVKALKLAEKLSISNDKCMQCDSDFAADFGTTGELSHQSHCLFAVLSTLPEQAESLLADRDRLDWLEKEAFLAMQDLTIGHEEFSENFVIFDEGLNKPEMGRGETIRAAIDAARASEKGE